MDISHLLFAGCSFTFCQGLEIEKAWPTLIAKNLNCNIVNLATPGVGNDNIYRKVHEYIYINNKIEGSKPLVILCFSDPWRKEVWSKEHHLTLDFDDYAPVAYPKDKPSNYHEYAMIENWNEEDFYRKSIIYKLNLVNLFEKFNIPYLFTDAFPQYPDLDAYAKIQTKFSELKHATETKYYIDNIYDIATKFNNLPCGHYGEEACYKISEHILDSIKTLYPNLKFRNDINYLRLSEYIKLDKYHQKFPIWCSLEEQSDILS